MVYAWETSRDVLTVVDAVTEPAGSKPIVAPRVEDIESVSDRVRVLPLDVVTPTVNLCWHKPPMLVQTGSQ